jgi:hypothetical protein
LLAAVVQTVVLAVFLPLAEVVQAPLDSEALVALGVLEVEGVVGLEPSRRLIIVVALVVLELLAKVVAEHKQVLEVMVVLEVLQPVH